MKRGVIIAAAGAVAVVGLGVGGWFLYQRHLSDRDKLACFNGTDPDACYRQAVMAFKNGQISEEDRLIKQHCYQRFGIETGNAPDVRGAALCVVQLRQRVEAAALK